MMQHIFTIHIYSINICKTYYEEFYAVSVKVCEFRKNEKINAKITSIKSHIFHTQYLDVFGNNKIHHEDNKQLPF